MVHVEALVGALVGVDRGRRNQLRMAFAVNQMTGRDAGCLATAPCMMG